MRPGAALWRALAAGDDLPAPAEAWRLRLGDDHARMGRLLAPTTERSSWWPCGKGRECVRRLVDEGATWAAVCVDEDWRCDTATVAPSATVLHALREERLLGALRQGLALGGPPPAPLPGQRAWALGNRAFGATLTRVYYAACADAAVLDAVAIADPPADGVLVVVTTAGVPTDDARELAEERGVDLRPLGGWAALSDDGAVAFDLDELLLRHRFRGVDHPPSLLSRRRRLVLDPARRRVWFDGALMEIPERPLSLLMALARRPGVERNRLDLYPEVWGSEYEDDDLARLRYRTSIRQYRLRLPNELPIETKDGSDAIGGYRLALNQDEIAWWSDPPSQATSQDKRR